MDSKFMTTLKETLNNEKLSPKTIEMYIIKLRILNENKTFDNLSFLKKKAIIKTKLEAIQNDNTRKSYVASIVSILNRQEGKVWQDLNKYYKELFLKERNIFSEKPAHEKSETQAENWMSWDEVMEIHDKLKTKVDEVQKKNRLTNADKKLIENYFLLCLYTQQPPRRNSDYYFMKVGQGDNEKFNYVDLKDGKYYFNNFKTSKSGKETIDIPEQMTSIIKWYINLMNLNDGDFLLYPDDDTRTNSNRITKSLNSIFNKKIGASMLRHIYLTNKYGDLVKEQKEDADFMAHGTSTQSTYIMNEKENVIKKKNNKKEA